MPSIGDFVNKDEPEFRSFEQVAEQEMQAETEVAAVGPRWSLPEWLKRETGPGEIEDYLSHPLNFSHSRGMAQILRGLTGIVGSLRYAVIDIFLGALQMGRERRMKAQAVEVAAHVAASEAN